MSQHCMLYIILIIYLIFQIRADIKFFRNRKNNITALCHRNYIGTSEYSREDKIWHGKVLNLSDTNDLIIYEGESWVKLQREFKSAINNYIKWIEKQ